MAQTLAAIFGAELVAIPETLTQLSERDAVACEDYQWALFCFGSPSQGRTFPVFFELAWQETITRCLCKDEQDLRCVVVTNPRLRQTVTRDLPCLLGSNSSIEAPLMHGIWSWDEPLAKLEAELQRTAPCEWKTILARRKADVRWRAIQQFKNALNAPDVPAIGEAIAGVIRAFDSREFELDAFCRPPQHANGNKLRNWLREWSSDHPNTKHPTQQDFFPVLQYLQ